MAVFLEEDVFITEIAYVYRGYEEEFATRFSNRSQHAFVYFFETNCTKWYVFENGRRIDIANNTLLYLPKGITYTVYSVLPKGVAFSEQGGMYVINFQLSTQETFDPFLYVPKVPKLAFDLFKGAVRSIMMQQPGCTTKCAAALYSLIYQMKEEYYAGYFPSQKAALLQPAMAHIEKHLLEEGLQVSYLASLCGVSEVHFRSVFRSVHGMLPKEYIIHLRLNNARTLLLSTQHSVHKIANLCGYDDDAHFSRAFKRTYGVTPGEFRLRSPSQEEQKVNHSAWPKPPSS